MSVHPKRQYPRKIKAFIRVPLFFLAVSFLSLRPASPLQWVNWNYPPKVALTFDDGPHPLPTLQLCDVLAQYHAPATFFIVGSVAAQYPQTLKFLAARGHEVAGHTWTHSDIRRMPPETLRGELDRTRALIQSVTGRDTFLFRTPGCTEAYLRRTFRVPSGYQLVLWDVHSLDQEGRSARQIADRVLSQVKNGDVVLMHNGLASTRAALEIIIPALQAKGYEFVTVSDLLKSRPRSRLYARRSAFLQS